MITTKTTRHCDRCRRVIETDLTPDAEYETTPAGLTFKLGHRSGSCQDLCDRCKTRIGNLLDRVMLVKS